MPTQQELITAAYQELGLIDPVESLGAEMLAFGLQKMNRLIDTWNAVREAVYVEEFADHTLTPSLNPHTFGPSGATFTVTQRPVTIDAIQLVLNASTPTIKTLVRDESWPWYARLSVPDLETSIPTNFYYAPSWPNGSLYLWPVPATAYPITVWRRVLLTQVTTVTDTFSLPPGYWDAIVRTLAEDLAPAYNVPVPASLAMKAAEARSIVWANNIVVPSIVTRDSGMPCAGSGGGYSYLTGTGGGR